MSIPFFKFSKNLGTSNGFRFLRAEKVDQTDDTNPRQEQRQNAGHVETQPVYSLWAIAGVGVYRNGFS